MLVVFLPIFVAATDIIFWYDFVAPLIFLKEKKENTANKENMYEN